ncbi:MAG: CHAT domain-containing tetratricopeptide repeat protein [Bacteroidota bacterium]
MLKTFRPSCIIWLFILAQAGWGSFHALIAQPPPSDSLKWSAEISQLSKNGRKLFREGKQGQGEQLMQKAIRQGEEHLSTLDPELAKAYGRLANSRSEQTDFYEAASLFEKAHEIKVAIPDSFSRYSVASSHLNYGYNLGRIGRLTEAEALLREGLELLEFAQKADLEGRYSRETWNAIFQNAYSMFSTVLIEKKEYSSAIDYYRRSLEILRNSSSIDSLGLAAAYMDLGRAYFTKGDSLAARQNYEASLEIQLRLPRSSRNLDALANVYLNFGAFYQRYSDYSQALTYLEKIEQLSQQSGTNMQARLLDSYLNRANIYKQQQKYAEGKYWLDQAQQLAKALYPERHPTVVRVQMLKGLIYAEEKAYPQASEYFDQALALLYTEGSQQELSRVYNQPLFWEALGYKGNIALEAYQNTENQPSLTEAYASFSLAIQLLDSIRIGLESPGAKEILVGSAKEYYENAIETCRQLYLLKQDDTYLHEAFRFAENSKALLLREALNEIQAQEFAGLPPTLLDSIEYLRKKMELNRRQILDAQTQATQQANGQPTNPKLEALEAEAIGYRQNYYELIRNLEEGYPEYYQLKYDLTTVNPEALQQKLTKEQTVMYAYFRGEKALYIFEISGQKIQLHRVKHTEDLDEALHQFLANLSDPRRYSQGAKSPAFFQEYIDQAYLLYQGLLPNLDQYPQYHLLVIPDGKLGFLPFELLLDRRPSADAPVVYYQLPYLIRSFPIRYEYTASFFLDHPNIPLNRRAYAGFAPHYPRPEENPVTDCLTDYLPLVFNKQEVNAVANSIGGKAFLNEEATEQTFRKLSNKYRVLHLAMHAFTPGENISGFAKADSGYSGLAFTPPRCDIRPPADNDGFLHTYELYNLRLNTELVVLSACNTGRGKMVRGEGIYSLARAFKYAGCANIVMSLWQVDDRATEQIVTAFFDQLKAGISKDEALRQAKLAYLDSAPDDHPFFWAALVLIGDSKPVPMDRNWPWLLAGVLGLVGIATAAWLWNRRRQRG